MENIKKVKPVFIIGAQRSGTTLLRLLLNAGDEIAIPEEGTFFMPLLRKSLSKKLSNKEINNFLSYLEGNTQFNLWGIDTTHIKAKFSTCNIYVVDLMQVLYELYADKEYKKRWGDKTPSFFRMVKNLSSLFPEALFVHLVRDGRDLYLSWKEMDKSKGNPSVSAIEWYYKTNKARNDLIKYADGRYIEVKYENLVDSTKATLTDICNFCELQYTDKMLEFWTKSNVYIGNHHSKLIFSKVTTSSVQKWKNVPDKEKRNINYFEIIAKKQLIKLGYSVAINHIKIHDYFLAHILLLTGLPYRFFVIFKTMIILDISLRHGLPTTASGSGDKFKHN